MRLRYLGELLYPHDWAFNSESLEILKEKLEARKRAMEPKGIGMRVKRNKIKTQSEKAKKKVPWTKEKPIILSSIYFRKTWVHKRYSSIRGRLKQDDQFIKCQTCTCQETGKAHEWME